MLVRGPRWGPLTAFGAGAPGSLVAVERPARFASHRYLGDKRSIVVHDLDATDDACAIDELVRSERFLAFGPDTLPEARNRGYRPCPHCALAVEDVT